MKQRRGKRMIRSKLATPSITEWFKKIDTPSAKILLKEDNTKYDRLEVVNKVIGLPYAQPIKLQITDVLRRSKLLKSILKKLADKQCILRLVPIIPDLPKIRRKGGLLKNNLRWFHKQDINPLNYKVEILSRCPNPKWASIFIVGDNGVWGEIIKGGLSQLARGKSRHAPAVFSYDFKNWRFSKGNFRGELKILKEALKKIHVNDSTKREKLRETLLSDFAENNYLKGYFEFTVWPKKGIQFTDYNRYQAAKFKDFNVWKSLTAAKDELRGLCANQGIAKGKVNLITHSKIKNFKPGDILVCRMIGINHLPLMQKAGAIIIEEGALLCHAALISREIGKPCLVQVKNATKKLQNGQLVEVDAGRGIVRVVK